MRQVVEEPIAAAAGRAQEIPLDAGELAALREAALGDAAPIGELARLRGISLPKATALLADAVGFAALDEAALEGFSVAADLLPLAQAQQLACVVARPLGTELADSCWCLSSDPFDLDAQTRVQHAVGGPVRFALAPPQALEALLARGERQASAVQTARHDAGLDEAGPAAGVASDTVTLSFASVSAAQSAAERLVASTLLDAHSQGASDVHFERTPRGLAVRSRLDGVLGDPLSIEGTGLAEQAISRIKVMASLDIAEHRVPQDGSLRVRVQGREVDLRISVMPSVHGEDAVVRILDKQSLVQGGQALRLEALGFDAPTLAQLRHLLEEPYGMLLVTGPTGSGKTTTLYAALSEVDSARNKVVTIEDPVEYQLARVLQVPVNEKKGLTFAVGLRSILRHDPDIIMVGEIRDTETAEIAVQSALTGHLVLSTVHANNVFDVFSRLSHMRLENYALVAAVNGVWAQRLVRLNCLSCCAAGAPDLRLLERMGLTPEATRGWRFARGTGCLACRGTGYRGRRAIAEVLRLDAALREQLLARQPMDQIRQHAMRAQGMRPLLQGGLDLVREGKTTLEEVRRVATLD